MVVFILTKKEVSENPSLLQFTRDSFHLRFQNAPSLPGGILMLEYLVQVLARYLWKVIQSFQRKISRVTCENNFFSLRGLFRTAWKQEFKKYGQQDDMTQCWSLAKKTRKRQNIENVLCNVSILDWRDKWVCGAPHVS